MLRGSYFQVPVKCAVVACGEHSCRRRKNSYLPYGLRWPASSAGRCQMIRSTVRSVINDPSVIPIAARPPRGNCRSHGVRSCKRNKRPQQHGDRSSAALEDSKSHDERSCERWEGPQHRRICSSAALRESSGLWVEQLSCTTTGFHLLTEQLSCSL